MRDRLFYMLFGVHNYATTRADRYTYMQRLAVSRSSGRVVLLVCSSNGHFGVRGAPTLLCTPVIAEAFMWPVYDCTDLVPV